MRPDLTSLCGLRGQQAGSVSALNMDEHVPNGEEMVEAVHPIFSVPQWQSGDACAELMWLVLLPPLSSLFSKKAPVDGASAADLYLAISPWTPIN